MRVLIDILEVKLDLGVLLSKQNPIITQKFSAYPATGSYTAGTAWIQVNPADLDDDTRKRIAIELLEIAKGLCPDAPGFKVKTCSECDGHGTLTKQSVFEAVRMACGKCAGKGLVPA